MVNSTKTPARVDAISATIASPHNAATDRVASIMADRDFMDNLTRSFLGKLPPELRNRICEDAIIKCEPIEVDTAVGKTGSGLLRSCHQLRIDYAPSYYSWNTFKIALTPDPNCSARHWLRALPGNYARMLTRVLCNLNIGDVRGMGGIVGIGMALRGFVGELRATDIEVSCMHWLLRCCSSSNTAMSVEGFYEIFYEDFVTKELVAHGMSYTVVRL